MAINLDYDIDLQLEAAATEAEIAATSEPELQQEDVLAGTPEDLSAAALYLREVARNPLLTPQEEIDFAQRNEKGRAAREELRNADDTLSARAPPGARADRGGWCLDSASARRVQPSARRVGRAEVHRPWAAVPGPRPGG